MKKSSIDGSVPLKSVRSIRINKVLHSSIFATFSDTLISQKPVKQITLTLRKSPSFHKVISPSRVQYRLEPSIQKLITESHSDGENNSMRHNLKNVIAPINLLYLKLTEKYDFKNLI